MSLFVDCLILLTFYAAALGLAVLASILICRAWDAHARGMARIRRNG